MSQSTCLISPVTSTWKCEIPKCALLNAGSNFHSPVFEINRLQWQINASLKNNDEYFSIYLYSHSFIDVRAAFTLTILNDRNEKFVIRKSSSLEFKYPNQISWGWPEFIKKQDLFNELNGLVVKDAILILCEVVTDEILYNDLHWRILGFPMPEKRSNCEDFKVYFNNSKFSDVDIKVGRKMLHAHKVILSSKSPVFAAMFEHDMMENRLNIVKIQDLSYEVLKKMLNYMYTGEVDLKDISLLAAAEKYELLDLKRKCELQLCEEINQNNVLEYLKYADLYNADNLKKKTIEFFVSNHDNIIKTEEFKNFCTECSHIHIELYQALSSRMVNK